MAVWKKYYRKKTGDEERKEWGKKEIVKKVIWRKKEMKENSKTMNKRMAFKFFLNSIVFIFLFYNLFLLFYSPSSFGFLFKFLLFHPF